MTRSINEFSNEVSARIIRDGELYFKKYGKNTHLQPMKYSVNELDFCVDTLILMMRDIAKNGFYGDMHIVPEEYVIMYLYLYWFVVQSDDKTESKNVRNILMPNLRQLLKNTDELVDYQKLLEETDCKTFLAEFDNKTYWLNSYTDPVLKYYKYHLSTAQHMLLLNGVAKLRIDRKTNSYLPEYIELLNNGE